MYATLHTITHNLNVGFGPAVALYYICLSVFRCKVLAQHNGSSRRGSPNCVWLHHAACNSSPSRQKNAAGAGNSASEIRSHGIVWSEDIRIAVGQHNISYTYIKVQANKSYAISM